MDSNDNHIINSGENESQEFELIELGKVCKISMGQSPPSEFYNHEGHGTPFLQGVKTFCNKYPKYDTWVTKPLKVAKKGEVLFSVRAPVGEVNIAKTDVCIGRGLASISGSNNEFIFYLLRAFREKIINRQTGTVFGAVGREILESTKFPIPSETEQVAIAKILSDLDSKIELNQKMNKTLESIAQTMFKHWFIDFEFPNEEGKPYKSNEGEMVDSELGEIPKDWKLTNFTEEFVVNMGQSPPGKSYNTEGRGEPFFQGRKDFGERFPSIRVYCNDPKKFASKGETLISVRAPVGDLNKALVDCCIGRGLASVKHSSGSLSYTFYTMLYMQNRLKDFASKGTVFGSISKSDFGQLNVIAPRTSIIREFEKIIGAFDEMIELNTIQNGTLEAARDSLLPKLITGKVRVPLEE